MIQEDNQKEYWKNRSDKQGRLTVGFNGANNLQQEINYNIRKDFIFSYVPDIITLDYGCGIGRYSDRFTDYLGVDITENHINIALKEHPDKDFILLPNTNYDSAIDFDFEQVFTATVLQHCSDESVSQIFESISKKNPKATLCLYENSQVKSETVCARTSQEYYKLAKKYFNISTIKSYSHKIHGEEHTLTILN